VRKGAVVELNVRLRDPAASNAAGRTPSVARVDVLVGPIAGSAASRSTDRAPGTAVARRFTASDWRQDGEIITITWRLPAITGPLYLRVRGTGTSELEPVADSKGENPWDDLWFYANPIFITLK
jgi:hypothetical protein